MPNWTTNTLMVSAGHNQSPTAIKDFLDAIRSLEQPKEGEEPAALDFNRLIPMPELLRHTGTGSAIIDGARVGQWYVVREYNYKTGEAGIDRRFTPEEEEELARIGYASWYDWSCDMWGTKWNACEPVIVIPTSEQLRSNTPIITAVIEFRTAWSAPAPIQDYIFDRFPDYDIAFKWVDEFEEDVEHWIVRRANGSRSEFDISVPQPLELGDSDEDEEDEAEVTAGE